LALFSLRDTSFRSGARCACAIRSHYSLLPAALKIWAAASQLAEQLPESTETGKLYLKAGKVITFISNYLVKLEGMNVTTLCTHSSVCEPLDTLPLRKFYRLFQPLC
jgi:hypothetical protein